MPRYRIGRRELLEARLPLAIDLELVSDIRPGSVELDREYVSSLYTVGDAAYFGTNTERFGGELMRLDPNTMRLDRPLFFPEGATYAGLESTVVWGAA